MKIFIVALFAIGVGLVAFFIYATREFSDECKAHGGAHATFPYKSAFECWSADGRRVFW